MCLKPPSSKLLERISSLILGVKLVQMKAFYNFCISSKNCVENEIASVRYAILDSAVLKIVTFSSNVIFFILHKFKTLRILVILFTKFFFELALFNCKTSVHLNFLQYLLIKQYIWYSKLRS